MKVELLDRQTDAVFKPIQVLVTVETQEDYDALKAHEGEVFASSYQATGITQKSANILIGLVDGVFYACMGQKQP